MSGNGTVMKIQAFTTVAVFMQAVHCGHFGHPELHSAISCIGWEAKSGDLHLTPHFEKFMSSGEDMTQLSHSVILCLEMKSLNMLNCTDFWRHVDVVIVDQAWKYASSLVPATVAAQHGLPR
jgi:hypothetical protein